MVLKIMSNEYKDWLWDRVWDLALERGIVDQVHKMEPTDPSYGAPRFLYGVKNNQLVKFEILDDEIEDYRFEYREF